MISRVPQGSREPATVSIHQGFAAVREAYLALEHQSQQKKRPMKEIAQAIILSAQVRESVAQFD